MSYDCSKCPAYCCTYEIIPVTKQDIARLAKRFEITEEEAEQKYTKVVDGQPCMRHRHDEIFKTACQFLHPETRRCTVYEHRPTICRQYPDSHKCGYYEFLKFERGAQGDKKFIPLQRF
jgi:hypothetical protein